MRFFKNTLVGVVFAFASALPSNAIDIIWNYDYDTTEFFTEERRLVLGAVANRLSHVTIDSPNLEQPESPGYWLWEFDDPTTGEFTSLNGSLQAGSLTIFVGAYDIGGTTLGRGGPVGYDFQTSSQEWYDSFASLLTPEVFKPFAGSLSITTSANYTWYSGLSDDVPEGQIDLYSVVLHELGHILGIGTVFPWMYQIEDGYFTGDETVALYGDRVKVNGTGDHFDNVSWEGSPLIMNSSIGAGERYDWSVVEDAVLKDLGYVVIPEPTTIGFAVIGLGLLATTHRRRKACK